MYCLYSKTLQRCVTRKFVQCLCQRFLTPSDRDGYGYHPSIMKECTSGQRRYLIYVLHILSTIHNTSCTTIQYAYQCSLQFVVYFIARCSLAANQELTRIDFVDKLVALGMRPTASDVLERRSKTLPAASRVVRYLRKYMQLKSNLPISVRIGEINAWVETNVSITNSN